MKWGGYFIKVKKKDLNSEKKIEIPKTIPSLIQEKERRAYYGCWIIQECDIIPRFISQLKMGGVVAKGESPNTSAPESKLETKIIEVMKRREVGGSTLKSLNTIILKFPKIDESLRKYKATFEEFDEDGNGAIDLQELKHCLSKMEINFTDEETSDLFEACDINECMGMNFNEFIVLLCLVYLLKEDSTTKHTTSKKSCIGMPNLEATFETIVDAFMFLDKNKDGCVSKNEMVDAINETIPGERSSGGIAMKRFEEMDWDKNGLVNFKEFLFTFTRWVGIEDFEDEEEEENS